MQKAFFGPFQVSVMLDCNGCNTTAATTIARIAKARGLAGDRAVVLGLGAVGLRSAVLLQGEGCEVTAASLPADLFDDDRPYHRPHGLGVAEELGLERSRAVRPRRARGDCSTTRRSSCARVLRGRGAAQDVWKKHPSVELLADYNAAEPLGIEGTKATDDLADYDGKLVLGALAIGGPKMKVHKACVRRLFESNDLVLDAEAVYAIAKERV